jgi:hypothetical protein
MIPLVFMNKTETWSVLVRKGKQKNKQIIFVFLCFDRTNTDHVTISLIRERIETISILDDILSDY